MPPKKTSKSKDSKPPERIVSGTGNRANPLREYVAGGDLASSTYNFLKVLPPSQTEFTDCIDPKIYERMLTDPEVNKCVRLLKLAILADGIAFQPSVKKGEENYEEAKRLADFVTRNFSRLDTPLRRTVEGLLDAIVYGHKVAEQTYQYCKEGEDKGKLVHKTIKVKPRDTTAFVVDEFMNVKGLLALNTKYGARKGVSHADPASVLPRAKFVVLSINPKDEDPRGQSMLRAAVNMWDLKVQVWPEYLRWLLQCALPVLVGTTADFATIEQARGGDNQPETNEDGSAKMVTAVDAMLNAMVNMRNRSAIAIPNGAKIETIETLGDGASFRGAINLFDEQIDTAILNETLATREGEHQSRSAAQTHHAILDLVVWWLKGIVRDMIESDLVRPLIRYNFGEEALMLRPKVSLGDSERRNFAEDAKAIAALCQAGFLSKSQLPEIDNLLVLPQRSSENDELVPLRSALPQPGEEGAVNQTQKATPTDPAPKPTTSDSAKRNRKRRVKSVKPAGSKAPAESK